MHMHVLFITRSLQRSPGGMQKTARILLDALQERADVRLAVCGWSGPKPLLPLFLCIALVRSLLFRGECVHLGDALCSCIIPYMKFFRPGLRVTCTVHGLDLVYPKPVYQWLLRGLRYADAVVAVSNATAKAAVRIGVPADRVLVVPWGLAISAIPRIPPTQPVLVSVGRQIRRKGTAWFVEHVLPRIRRDVPTVRYIVLGSGPELIALRFLVLRLGLEACVEVRGRVDEAVRNEVLRNATLLIMPNIPVAGDMEGFGVACIEAASIGIPVVAARLEGVTDAVIEHETGLFFTPLDAADAASVTLHALRRTWSAQAVQDSCRRHFALATVVQRYVTDVFSPSDHRHSHGG